LPGGTTAPSDGASAGSWRPFRWKKIFRSEDRRRRRGGVAAAGVSGGEGRRRGRRGMARDGSCQLVWWRGPGRQLSVGVVPWPRTAAVNRMSEKGQTSRRRGVCQSRSVRLPAHRRGQTHRNADKPGASPGGLSVWQLSAVRRPPSAVPCPPSAVRRPPAPPAATRARVRLATTVVATWSQSIEKGHATPAEEGVPDGGSGTPPAPRSPRRGDLLPVEVLVRGPVLLDNGLEQALQAT
jgi:hypothetical protein